MTNRIPRRPVEGVLIQVENERVQPYQAALDAAIQEVVRDYTLSGRPVPPGGVMVEHQGPDGTEFHADARAEKTKVMTALRDQLFGCANTVERMIVHHDVGCVERYGPGAYRCTCTTPRVSRIRRLT